jgi:protein KIBRA
MFRYIKTMLLPSPPPINMACCTKPVEDLRKPTFGDNFPLAVSLNKLYTKTLQVNVWCIDPSQREDCVVSVSIYYESCWQYTACLFDHFMITWFSDI